MADPIRTGTEVELAYAAGIIDGEGCISMFESLQSANSVKPKIRNARGLRYRYKVIVKMVDHEAVQLLYEIFGGSLYWNPLQKLRARQRFPQITWTVGEIRAVVCLRQLLPYLRLKRKQAELLVLMEQSVSKYRHCGKYRRVSEEDTETRRGLIKQLKSRNQREYLREKVVAIA